MKKVMIVGSILFFSPSKILLRNRLISIKSSSQNDKYQTSQINNIIFNINVIIFQSSKVLLIASQKKNITPINEKIRASEVMLIGSNGEKQGLVSIDLALNSAKAASLDLVQVSPSDANPVVCKLLDYGKHVFEKKKSTSSSKVKVKRNTVKEIKFRPSTDIGDYNIKLKKIKSFILDGDKTKISVRFRGREILNSNLGLDLLNRIRDELEEIAQVDQEPSLEGRQLLMVLSPLKKK